MHAGHRRFLAGDTAQIGRKLGVGPADEMRQDCPEIGPAAPCANIVLPGAPTFEELPALHVRRIHVGVRALEHTAARMANIAIARSFCSSDKLGVGSSELIFRSGFSSASSMKRM